MLRHKRIITSMKKETFSWVLRLWSLRRISGSLMMTKPRRLQQFLAKLHSMKRWSTVSSNWREQRTQFVDGIGMCFLLSRLRVLSLSLIDMCFLLSLSLIASAEPVSYREFYWSTR
jgi:hypothetical protein